MATEKQLPHALQLGLLFTRLWRASGFMLCQAGSRMLAKKECICQERAQKRIKLHSSDKFLMLSTLKHPSRKPQSKEPSQSLRVIDGTQMKKTTSVMKTPPSRPLKISHPRSTMQKVKTRSLSKINSNLTQTIVVHSQSPMNLILISLKAESCLKGMMP